MKQCRDCQEGFTLIELVCCLAVAAILAGLAHFQFRQWSFRSTIEKQITELYDDLIALRTKSLFEKTPRVVVIARNHVAAYSGLDTGKAPVSKKSFANPMAWKSATKEEIIIRFDTKGITDDQVTVCIDPVTENTASVDSMVISKMRIRMGKRRAGKACDRDFVDLR